MKTIYMDHASTTAMSKDALEEMYKFRVSVFCGFPRGISCG